MARRNNGRHAPSDWSEKEVFTTGEAAEICNVSLQTIIRCFDAGRLQGFRVPGSRFRRIPRADLLRFLRANSISTDALERPQRRVLLIAPEGGRTRHVRALLDGDGRYDVACATTPWDAGLCAGNFRPHVVLVIEGLIGADGETVAAGLAATTDLADTPVVALEEPTDDAPARPRARRTGSRLERLALDGPALLDCIAETLGV